MDRFTKLYMRLDSTNRTTEKVAALRDYFEAAPDEDAAWALFFLTGNTLPRAISGKTLRQWIAEERGLELWLVEECYEAVGDLAETMALLLPPAHTDSVTIPLNKLVEERLIPLKSADDVERKRLMRLCWNEMNSAQRFVWHKLVLGGFRVGVSRTLVIRALAELSKIETAVMAHRVMGSLIPTAENFRKILNGGESEDDAGKPYPFFLAHPISGDPAESLSPAEEFQFEWKFDGIRSQLIRRRNETNLWSRGEELITDRFPEVIDFGKVLPEGTVLDGEIVAWNKDSHLPDSFQKLQTRINRKKLTNKILTDAPVRFIAYDILEYNGEDIRSYPLKRRRILLESLASSLALYQDFMISKILKLSAWSDAANARGIARDGNTEGLMVKRKDSAYGVGRVRGDWWKWKVDPLTIDVVLTYAQRGHGRRAGLFTDYTFGAWHGEELVTVAKAYSGLTDKELGEIDMWIKRNTTERFGPIRMVKPELVFEIGFDSIQENPRNKSGIAVRFPRILRWRKDKSIFDADKLENVKDLLNAKKIS